MYTLCNRHKVSFFLIKRWPLQYKLISRTLLYSFFWKQTFMKTLLLSVGKLFFSRFTIIIQKKYSVNYILSSISPKFKLFDVRNLKSSSFQNFVIKMNFLDQG